VDWLVEVTNVESPIHLLEAARRIANAAGVQRIGNRIQQVIGAASDLAVSQGRFRRSGDFLWALAVTPSIIRDRSSLPVGLRRIELIAPEELATTILAVTEKSLGMELDEIPPAVAKLLGFGRAGEDIRIAVERETKSLIENGKLELRGKMVVSIPSR
jgi:hypothetical protein